MILCCQQVPFFISQNNIMSTVFSVPGVLVVFNTVTVLVVSTLTHPVLLLLVLMSFVYSSLPEVRVRLTVRSPSPP